MQLTEIIKQEELIGKEYVGEIVGTEREPCDIMEIADDDKI